MAGPKPCPPNSRTSGIVSTSGFYGADLAEAVLDSFAESLRARFGEKRAWPPVSVESQLIRHRAGYFLGPHSDLHTKLVVLLLYLAPDESASSLELRCTAQGSRLQLP